MLTKKYRRIKACSDFIIIQVSNFRGILMIIPGLATDIPGIALFAVIALFQKKRAKN